MSQCLIMRHGGVNKDYVNWGKAYNTVYGDITGTYVQKYQGGYMTDGGNEPYLGSITNDTNKDRVCICVFSSNLSFTFKYWTITNGKYSFQIGAGKIPYCTYYWAD